MEFKDMFKGDLSGLAIGVGFAVLAPVVLPVLGSVARPLLKTAVKGFLVLSDSARSLVAEVSEEVGDIVAEARAEHEGASTNIIRPIE
jgi:hypothetical protein